MSRGRGRGRGQAFHLQQVGLSPGEAPPAILQPPPLFPDLQRKPLHCKRNEVDNYMLSVKQEFRTTIANGPLYIKLVNRQGFKIERYSDRYRSCTRKGKTNFNAALIPKELLSVARKRKQSKKLKTPITSSNLPVDQLKEESSENESGEEQLLADTLYDEEQEEEGDYQLTYFDDGEDYGIDEDDNLDDGPCYWHREINYYNRNDYKISKFFRILNSLMIRPYQENQYPKMLEEYQEVHL